MQWLSFDPTQNKVDTYDHIHTCTVAYLVWSKVNIYEHIHICIEKHQICNEVDILCHICVCSCKGPA